MERRENGDNDGDGLYGLTVQECMSLCDEQGDGSMIKRFGGVDDVAQLLRVHNLKDGISGDVDKQVAHRKQVFGENMVPEPRRKTYLGLLLDALKDLTLLILCAAAVVSLVVAFIDTNTNSPCADFDPDTDTDGGSHGSSTEFLEPVAILVAVVVVSNVTAINDYSKEKQFRKLNETSRNTVVVQTSRGGRRVDVPAKDVVVGDVVHISVGQQVPTDGILIDGQNVSCDESSLTGEPDLKKKQPGTYLKAGAVVSEGDGRMLVLAVGLNTDSGKAISILSDSEEDLTPLQAKLNVMANQIGKMGTFMAVLTFVSAGIRFAVCRGQIDDKFEASELQIMLDYMILGVTIVVVAVPEGLPLAVTISLAYSMRKMMKDQNFVRRLAACETMGGATNICSDKTGTLTENRMAVTEGVVLGHRCAPMPQDDDDQHTKAVKANPDLFTTLLEGIATNTQSSSFVQLSNKFLWEFKGNRTECALLVMCFDFGGNIQRLRDQWADKHVRTLNFTSERKRMSTVFAIDGGYRVHTKGAGEMVLSLCSSMVEDGGAIKPFTDELRREASQQVDRLTKTGLRALCIAYKDVKTDRAEEANEVDEDALESELTLLAIVGIKDPVRKAVPKSVKACKRAGITVRMVTGDNIDTAKHIARECGILDPSGIALEGAQFREMSDSEIEKVLPKLQVLARSKPVDKFRLVKLLRDAGEVVAVTGDGTNDAPALKEADVGLAMGITGTDVAKNASDIVILDDNFTSIVKAVMWGRNVYDSIRKFLQFQLTVNVAALVVAYIGAVVNSRSPLTPVQLLWVNLIMDTLGALALATELPTTSLLRRPPYGRFESLINHRMWVNILGQGLLQIVVLLVMLFVGEDIYINSDYSSAKSQDVNYSMIFNAFVFLQVFNEINCRKLSTRANVFRGITRNPLFLGVIFLTTVLQVMLVEFGDTALNIHSLNAEEFFISLAIGTLSLPWAVVLKQIQLGEDQALRAERLHSAYMGSRGSDVGLELN